MFLQAYNGVQTAFTILKERKEKLEPAPCIFCTVFVNSLTVHNCHDYFNFYQSANDFYLIWTEIYFYVLCKLFRFCLLDKFAIIKNYILTYISLGSFCLILCRQSRVSFKRSRRIVLSSSFM